MLVDGIAVGTFVTPNTSYHQFTTPAFTVAAGTHTITFQGLDTAGGDNSVFIDAVQVILASAANLRTCKLLRHRLTVESLVMRR